MYSGDAETSTLLLARKGPRGWRGGSSRTIAQTARLDPWKPAYPKTGAATRGAERRQSSRNLSRRARPTCPCLSTEFRGSFAGIEVPGRRGATLDARRASHEISSRFPRSGTNMSEFARGLLVPNNPVRLPPLLSGIHRINRASWRLQ